MTAGGNTTAALVAWWWYEQHASLPLDDYYYDSEMFAAAFTAAYVTGAASGREATPLTVIRCLRAYLEGKDPMAAPLLCDGPDDDHAVVMLTLTADGDTSALCGPCLLDWCQGILQAAAPERLAAPEPKPAKPPRPRRTQAPSIAGNESGASVTELHPAREGE